MIKRTAGNRIQIAVMAVLFYFELHIILKLHIVLNYIYFFFSFAVGVSDYTCLGNSLVKSLYKL